MQSKALLAILAAALAAAAIVVAAIHMHTPSSHGMVSGETTATSAAGRTGGGAQYIVVVDLLGRKVRVPANVTRVVAVGPGALRILVYLNATQYVVGVEQVEKQWNPIGRVYIMAHPELRELPAISPGGPGKLPDPEMILKVKPQVIFATFLSREQADALQEKTGIPVVSLGSPVLTSVDSLKQLYKALLVAGKILHREERAKQLVDYMEKLVRDLEERTANATLNVKVYVGGIGYRGRRGITSTWCHYPLFTLLHVKSIVDLAGCRGGHLDVDKEFLLKWNPDIVFIDENGLALVLQDYVRDRGFYSSLKAFREGHVYGILPFNYYATNYELAFADAYYIGKILFPDRFKDVDPARKADEIIEFFDGKPLYAELARYYGGFKRLNLEEMVKGGGG